MMNSEPTSAPVTLAQKEWNTRKKRISEHLEEIVPFLRKKLIDMREDLEAIHDRKLWQHGDYKSFAEFCDKAVGVTARRVYQVLADGNSVRKALENNNDMRNNFASEQPEDQKGKTTYEPPAKTKKRNRKPEPEPVEVEPIEPQPPVSLAETTPPDATKSNGLLPPAASVDAAQVVQSLAFLTDDQRAAFFDEIGKEYCFYCGVADAGKKGSLCQHYDE